MSRIFGIYNDILKGSSITDGELEYAITYFRATEKCLSELGPNFHLAWNEAKRVLNLLIDFQRERNGK